MRRLPPMKQTLLSSRQGAGSAEGAGAGLFNICRASAGRGAAGAIGQLASHFLVLMLHTGRKAPKEQTQFWAGPAQVQGVVRTGV